ncbi:MAG: TerB family tellurite resistance protein [Pseudomonadota bacterium]
MIKDLSEWLLSGDSDGETAAPFVRPEVGAAGLLIVAAHRDGAYTDIEKDLATAALMKLFMLNNPDARALRVEAEEAIAGTRGIITFASAAKELDREDQEALITHLWRLVALQGETADENMLLSSIRDVLGFTRTQADALRPAA